jgi:head-tail adaptor
MIERFYKESLSTVVLARDEANYPHDMVETLVSFKGALASISGNEPYLDRQTTGDVTHKIATFSNVTFTRAMQIRYGTRTFEVVFVRPSLIKKGHHQEILCKEIT